ncbi:MULTISPECIES: hypothetical protein [unclassified Streptomyces]|uniref:hypothetical protein n=1 Tax=unclassified Streptomyces TaxID=2593676 RepID=UPI0033D46F49
MTALILALAVIAAEKLVHHRLGVVGSVGIVLLTVGQQTGEDTFSLIGAAAVLAALIPQKTDT